MARPAIVAALPRLREIAGYLLDGKDGIGLLVTETASGLDLHITGLAKDVKALARAEAASAALRAGFARVSIEDADVLTERRPSLPAGSANLLPPPGSFLQASAEAEAEMERIVREHLKFAAQCRRPVRRVRNIRAAPRRRGQRAGGGRQCGGD